MLFIDKLVKAEQEALAQPGDPRRGVVAVLRAFEGTDLRWIFQDVARQEQSHWSEVESALSTTFERIVAEAGR